jgi:uncharacterized protein YqgQ
MRNFLIIILLFIAHSAFSQLDSIQIGGVFNEVPDPLDTNLVTDAYELEVAVFDIDFLGEIVITVYAGDNLYPLFMEKYSKQEMFDQGLLDNNVYDNTISISLFDLDPEQDYRFEVLGRNLQGGNLPVNELIYHAQ